MNILIAKKQIDSQDAQKILNVFKNIDSVLNVFEFSKTIANEAVQDLLAQREIARNQKNWALADVLRHRLIQLGVIVRDPKIEG